MSLAEYSAETPGGVAAAEGDGKFDDRGKSGGVGSAVSYHTIISRVNFPWWLIELAMSSSHLL